jgi:hypothetical protein
LDSIDDGGGARMMPRVAAFLLCATVAHTAARSASAQSLPAPSRTVYKCEIAGKASYSDSPCLGAKKIDIEPTRGFSKASGREMVGSDIRREQTHEAFADAVKPLTGLDAKQLDAQGRRLKLSADANQECRRLDRDIATAEAEERTADRSALASTQERLFKLRQRFRELRC